MSKLCKALSLSYTDLTSASYTSPIIMLVCCLFAVLTAEGCRHRHGACPPRPIFHHLISCPVPSTQCNEGAAAACSKAPESQSPPGWSPHLDLTASTGVEDTLDESPVSWMGPGCSCGHLSQPSLSRSSMFESSTGRNADAKDEDDAAQLCVIFAALACCTNTAAASNR